MTDQQYFKELKETIFVPAIEIEVHDLILIGRLIWYVKAIDHDSITIARGYNTKRQINRVGLIRLFCRGDAVAALAVMALEQF